jgi:ComF family protein
MPLPETEAPAQSQQSRKPVLLRAWDRALDLVFPPRCVSCNAFGSFICERCRAEMVPADGPRCNTCWMPLNPEHSCRRCRAYRPALGGVRCAFVYDVAARDAVLALKFQGLSAAAPLMARPMAEVLAEWRPPVSCIVPVPLSGQRCRLRGYNQSDLLARQIAHLTGIPLGRRALIRRRHTTAQARISRDARWKNVEQAFRIGKETPTGGMLLIDDVITTGATLNACARVLLHEGAGAVFALTFARED